MATAAKKKTPAKRAPAKRKAPAKKAPAKKKIHLLGLDEKHLEKELKGVTGTVEIDDVFAPGTPNREIILVMKAIEKKSRVKFVVKAQSELKVRSYKRAFGLPKNLKVT